MHDVILGGVIVDILTGEERPRTTYEDLRQALIQYFLFHLEYPKAVVQAHVPFRYSFDGIQFVREIDLLVHDGPVKKNIAKDTPKRNFRKKSSVDRSFPNAVSPKISSAESFLLHPFPSQESSIAKPAGDTSATGNPVLLCNFCAGDPQTFVRENVALGRVYPCPLLVVTDMKQLFLYSTQTGELLLQGMEAFPRYEALLQMATAYSGEKLARETVVKETRILHAYAGLSEGCCNATGCSTVYKTK